jgi:hypothetical protein
MGNLTNSQIVFECRRESGKGPVGHHAGRRNPDRNSAEMDWRQDLVDASKRAQGAPPKPEDQPRLQYTVELIFFLSDASVDLDNLTKPVLDTLFSPGPPLDNQKPWEKVIGQVFPAAHDSQVFELNQRKTVVSETEREGVQITVSWSRP